MEKFTLKDPDLVVAIDVGSTYSGYAWQWREDFKKNRGNIEFNTNWGTGAIQLHKTKTCLLLHSDKELGECNETDRIIDSFGHLAERRFSNEVDDNPKDVHKNWFFFEGFKLMLYRAQSVDSTSTIEKYQAEDRYGQHFDIKEVMTKFIQALKDHFLSTLEDRGVTVDIANTLWVITVPKIWTDNSKDFMRNCAEASGIERSHLLLALEPEAAAIYCLHLPAQKRAAMNDFGQVGHVFLTADLGGGTVDISVTEVLEDGNLKERYPGKGDRIGGQDVNNAFFQACTEVIIGKVWHETFNMKNAQALLKLEKEFEETKVGIGKGSTERDERITVSLPWEMQNKLQNGAIQLRNTEEADTYFLKEEGGRLQFKSELVREKLFGETAKKVTSVITDTMRNASDISTVILVGGFAESPIIIDKLRTAIEKQFPGVQLSVPTSPFRAVLGGAVLFGHDPSIISSRISKLTYGIGTNSTFRETFHNKEKRWKEQSTGTYLCKDIFSIHVRKSQSVTLNAKQPSNRYNPIAKGQSRMVLNLFSSPEKEPKYTTDFGCTKLGEIEVKMPNTTGETSRKVEVTMIYGGTELAVTAQDLTTGNYFSTKIRFDNM